MKEIEEGRGETNVEAAAAEGEGRREERKTLHARGLKLPADL